MDKRIISEEDRLREILTRMIKERMKPEDLVYDAILRDDVEQLQILVQCGLKFSYSDNYIFSAVDNRAYKCLPVLLESGASITSAGRTKLPNGRFYFVEPMELACCTKQVDTAKLLIAYGAGLKTNAGVDLIRRYRGQLGDENCEELIRAQESYLNKKDKDTEPTMN